MADVIIPEIFPEVCILKDALVRDLPPGCRISISPLNRKTIRIVKSLGIVSEIHVHPNDITVRNAMPLYLGLAVLLCLPFAIYLLCKMKDGESLRSSVHDIVWRATRRQ